jgi:Flp pilus assembly pilin Flp
MRLFSKFLKGEAGTTAAEYALILAIIGASLIGSSTSLGKGMATADMKVSNALAAAVNAS